jgi:hypothetical protein
LTCAIHFSPKKANSSAVNISSLLTHYNTQAKIDRPVAALLKVQQP